MWRWSTDSAAPAIKPTGGVYHQDEPRSTVSLEISACHNVKSAQQKFPFCLHSSFPTECRPGGWWLFIYLVTPGQLQTFGDISLWWKVSSFLVTFHVSRMAVRQREKKSKTMDGHHNLEHHQAANIPPKTTTWIFMLDHLMCKLLSKWLSESVWELGSSAVEMLELPERVEVVRGMGFERVERRKVGVQNYLLGFISQIEHLWFFLTGVVKGQWMSEDDAGCYKRNSGRILDKLLNELHYWDKRLLLCLTKFYIFLEKIP